MKSEDNVVKNGIMKISPSSINLIELISVSFKYENAQDWALKDVSFEIAKNDKIALIGHNGAGKTSIVKLLLRLYNPQVRQIKINDIDIKQYCLTDLRNTITVLFQDYSIYPFSIKDNIMLGK